MSLLRLDKMPEKVYNYTNDQYCVKVLHFTDHLKIEIEKKEVQNG